MPPPGIVTFLTDFGLGDTFVGQMKGAALAVHPGLTFVDLTHDVPAHDILAGAVHLKMAYRAFPAGTVHVAVVDPGVGGERRGIVVRTASYYFVAPDNGLLSLVLDEEPAGEAFVLEAAHLRRHGPGATFDGRDVFAPAAAWILRGLSLDSFGPPAADLVRVELPEVRFPIGERVSVRVLTVDRFGNVTLHVPRGAVESGPISPTGPRLRVETARGTVETLRRTYSEAEAGEPFLLFNSADYLEIAIREGRASDRLALSAGDEVVVTRQA
jgi:S-adenosylmethionine hydrolase